MSVDYVLSSPELKTQVSFSYHNLSVVRRRCSCRNFFTFSSSPASLLAKGFAHGPLSLHPWQIELDFEISSGFHRPSLQR